MVKVREDLTGQKFGRWTVLYQTNDYIKPNGKHEAMWYCECECGNKVDVLGYNLKKGLTKSCGCLNRELVIQNNITNKRKHNEYNIENDIVIIYLSNDMHTTVNLDKWNEIPWIKELCWSYENGYATTTIPKQYRKEFNNKKKIKLHQLICPCEEGYELDHIDRNKLNNLTENLIPKTHMGNMQNCGIRSDNTSGTAGVSWNKTINKWRAYIMANHKDIYLGCFTNKEDAIKARKQAEIKYFGEYKNNINLD